MSPRKKQGGARRERTVFEWSILATSMVTIAAMVIALVVSGLRASNGPPDLRVTVARMSEIRSDGVPYEVTVRNAGGETAENVEIEITVGAEARTLNLTAVARSDEERGVVIFPPGTQGPAHADVQSYSETAR